MLQTFTVAPGTLALLKHLQTEPVLRSTRLVGGTALSLQIGHRKSDDLDLFSEKQALWIKAVCDFADRNKGDGYHKSCSYASAAFLYQMLREKF